MDSGQEARLVYAMPSGASRIAHGRGMPNDGILAAFDAMAQRSRDHIVARSITWHASAGAIDDWSRQAADRVHAAALPPGSVVGLDAPAGPAFLAGFLGVRRAGCTALLLDVTAAHDDRARV